MKRGEIGSATALVGVVWVLAQSGVAQEGDVVERGATKTVAAKPISNFAKPVRMRAADGVVKVEAPGYAAPALHDVDGDGVKDLVVGQFAGGKMRMYKGTSDGTYAAGEWLMAGGKPAEVPGVW